MMPRARCILCENQSLIKQSNGSWFCLDCGVSYRIDESDPAFERYHYFHYAAHADLEEQEEDSPKELPVLLNERTLKRGKANGPKET